MSRRRRQLVLAALFVASSPAVTAAEPGRLEARMRAAGLTEVRRPAAATPLVVGRLAGRGELEVVLFAGCAPGADAGRDAVLAAVTDLARTPQRHALEVVLCPAPASSPRAARAWLAQRSPADRDRLLAALHLEAGADGPGVALILPSDAAGGRRLPPAWLAHTAVAGARSAGRRLAVGAERWRLMAQLLGRYGRPRATTGAEPFLAAGVPALALSGVAARSGAATEAAGWPPVLAAIVRRLDGLAGRPRPDDSYLAFGGRIWARRDLYWAGLTIWVALLVGGLPGSWHGAVGDQRRRRGRWYLPGFAFRMLFLVAILTAPEAALTLLAPAGLLILVPARSRAPAVGLRLLALAPASTFAGYLLAAAIGGRAAAWPVQSARLALVLACLVLALTLIGRSRPLRQPARPAS